MRRAQMELMGMAFVVLLVSLGIIFAVRYIILSPSQSVASEYIRSQIPNRWVSAVFHTSLPDCHGANIQTVLQDCDENQDSIGLIDCGVSTSCEYANTTIEAILHESLEKWHVRYKLIISTPQGNIFNNGTCFGDQLASRFPIPGRQNSYVNLYIC